MKQRPVPWATDEDFMLVIGGTHRAGDRLILLALRYHDFRPENPDGAYPGHKRIAAFTGLSPSYVRNRLSQMARDAVIHVLRPGRFAHYYIIAPAGVTADGDTSGATAKDDMSPPEVARDVSASEDTRREGGVSRMSPSEHTSNHRHVTDVSPPERQSNRNKDNIPIAVDELESAVEKIISYYKKVHETRKVVDERQIESVRGALKIGFTGKDVCCAIMGNARDDWHRENGRHELSYIFRDSDTISRFIALHEFKKQRELQRL